jgi:hypothetical protein
MVKVVTLTKHEDEIMDEFNKVKKAIDRLFYELEIMLVGDDCDISIKDFFAFFEKEKMRREHLDH